MNRASFWIPASLIFLFGFILVSCSKNKYTTKPQISIKSINTFIPIQGTLTVDIVYTSKSGDIGGGHLVAIRNRLNQDPLPPGSANNDSSYEDIPTFPDQSKADIQFTEDWAGYLHQSPNSEPDSIVFKFAVIDRAGISSDTITSPLIQVESD
jgi:hypothetical protein